MNTATYWKQGMLSHIKENMYNRTGMKDAILVHALVAPMMDIVAIQHDALLSRLSSKISDNYPITDMLAIIPKRCADGSSLAG
jgi:hypothetical protein